MSGGGRRAMGRPEAIFFDLDDTLISAYGRAGEAWGRVLADFSGRFGGHDLDQVIDAVLAAAREFWGDPERHRIWRLKIRASRRETVRLGLARLGLRDKVLAAEIGDAFSDHREQAMTLFPGVHETLDRLRAEGLGLALVTNGAAEVQRAKIERFDLEGRFDRILIEGEFGAGKPEPEVYLHLLAWFGLAPDQAWMIGDNLDWEVVAPQRHGMTGIWCNCHGATLPTKGNVRPDHVITDIPEVLTLLGIRQEAPGPSAIA